MKALNQMIHEMLGKYGLLRYTNCIERGCHEYHGRSPSQLLLFELNHSIIAFHMNTEETI